MTFIYYLILIAPLAVLFALGYFPVVLMGRLITKRKLFGLADACAPFAGALGTALAFLFFGLLGFDRFAFASEHVRTAWQSSGFIYEMAQGLFSGAVCAIIVTVAGRFIPKFAERPKILTSVVAVLVAFIAFSFWPVLFSPFV